MPQSWEEVERANQFLKPAIRKMTQETSLKWKEAWLIALLCTRVAPKICLTFNPFETLYCQPFLYSDLLLDTEASSLEADTQTVAQFQATLRESGLQQKPNQDTTTPLMPQEPRFS